MNSAEFTCDVAPGVVALVGARADLAAVDQQHGVLAHGDLSSDQKMSRPHWPIRIVPSRVTATLA